MKCEIQLVSDHESSTGNPVSMIGIHQASAFLIKMEAHMYMYKTFQRKAKKRSKKKKSKDDLLEYDFF